MLSFLITPLIWLCSKELHNIHSCELVLRILRYLLVNCWFMFSLGLLPGVPPPSLGFIMWQTVSPHPWVWNVGVHGRAGRHWQKLHSQLKLLVDRVTQATGLWGVVYFSSPVANLFLFGPGKVARPGFWIAALAWFSDLDLLVFMAKDTPEEDFPTSPCGEEIAQWRHKWALSTWLIFTVEVTASKNMQKKCAWMLWLHEIKHYKIC